MDFENLVIEYRKMRKNRNQRIKLLADMKSLVLLESNDLNTGRYLYYKAEHLYLTNKLNQSVKHLRQAYMHLIKVDECVELISCVNLFGIIADLQGDYSSALTYYYQAMDIATKMKANMPVLVSNNNIGYLFFGQKAYKEAIGFFKEALKKATKVYKDIPLATVVIFRTNLAYAYAMGRYTKQALTQLAKLQLIDDQFFRNKAFDINCLHSIILCHQKDYQQLKIVEGKMMMEIHRNLHFDDARVVMNVIELWLSCHLYDLVRHSLDIVSEIFKKFHSSHLDVLVQKAYLKYYEAIGDQTMMADVRNKYINSIECDEDKQRINRVNALSDKMELHKIDIMLGNTTKEAITDQLTGIYNRRYLVDDLVTRYNNEKALNKDIGFLILDIDYFKQCNDQYGHLYGDECLKAIAAIIKSKTNNQTVAIRYGGDEFMLVFFAQNHQQINTVAIDVLQSVGQIPYYTDQQTNRHVTVSIGIYIGKPYKDDNIYDFIRNADKALYKAKEKKNTISIFDL